MVEKKWLVFVFLLVYSVNLIHAEDVQGSIQQQIASNQMNYLQNGQGGPNPDEVFNYYMQNNPEFKKQFSETLRIIGLLVILSIFDLIMKGFSMWRASKNNSRIWFWILLVVSTFGILPIIYLIFSKKPKKEEKKK